MSYLARVFLDVSVMKHSIRSRTILRPQPRQPAWLGGQILYEIVEEDPTSRKREEPLRTEIDLLSRVAQLARNGEIELLWHGETRTELLGTLPFPGPGSSVFGDVSITMVEGPIKYSRLLTPLPVMRLWGQTSRTMTYDFLRGIDYPRFRELQKACGAYQGDHAKPNPKQLLDAFHMWCAEHAKATHFLTTDFGLTRLVRQHKRWPPRVRVVKPSELLSEIEKQIAGGRGT